MKSIREGVLVVLPRNKQVVDVFTDKGWENHAVFEVKDGQLKQVKGPRLSIGQTNFVGRIMLGTKYSPVEVAK